MPAPPKSGAGRRKHPVNNVCTDSRQAKPGDLFFAIKGEHFDGHDFLNEVAAKGVAAVVVEAKKSSRDHCRDCAVLRRGRRARGARKIGRGLPAGI